MDIERELRSALRRRSPSPDFRQRVIQQSLLPRASGREGGRRPDEGAFRWRAVAAAGLLMAVLGGWAAHTIVQRREGERARQELLLALRITSAKLQEAQSHVVK